MKKDFWKKPIQLDEVKVRKQSVPPSQLHKNKRKISRKKVKENLKNVED